MSFNPEQILSSTIATSVDVDYMLACLLESGESIFVQMDAVCEELNMLFENMWTHFPKPSVLFPVKAMKASPDAGGRSKDLYDPESPYYPDGDGGSLECDMNYEDPRGPSYESIYGGVYVPHEASDDEYHEAMEEMVMEVVSKTDSVPGYVYDGYAYRAVDDYGVPIELPPLYNRRDLENGDGEMVDAVMFNEPLQEIQVG